MARLVITSKMSRLMRKIPHKMLINSRFVGIMQTPEVVVDMPSGQYELTIQSMFPYFSSTQIVTVQEASETHLEFADRELWWDILFVVDIVLWIVKRFLHLAAPWTWIYEIFTNGYFVLWLIYEWRIRKNYFRVKTYSFPSDK